MKNIVSPTRIAVFMFLFDIAFTFGQTIPGTLNYTESQSSSGSPTCLYTIYSYSWTFTDPSGVAHKFAGYSTKNVLSGSFVCTATTYNPLTEWSSDGLYYLQGTIGSATNESVTAMGTRGYVDPKFLVVGVTYAPPGPSASTFVQYQNSTFVGNTESISNSFENSSTESVSLSYGPSIPGVANAKITDTFSTTNSQTDTSKTTVTTSIQTTSGEKTSGTGNYFAPVDNDYDTIWVWLNPATIFTLYNGTLYNGSSTVWNGYGYDATDENGMDIVGISLGYLNGHFGAIPPDIQTRINRTWAAGQIWPAGDGPALTSADLAQIASSDPFSVSTYGLDYIGYVPPTPQTSDYRFAVSSCTPPQGSGNPIFDYEQANPSQTAAVYTCTLTYTNTTTQENDISTMYSQTFSVDVSFSGTGFLKSFSADLKNSSTLTWTTTEQSSITNTNTSTASLSVQGPPCNNVIQGQGPCVPVYDTSGNEPTQYQIYQDNMYGAFMFAPIHYY